MVGKHGGRCRGTDDGGKSVFVCEGKRGKERDSVGGGSVRQREGTVDSGRVRERWLRGAAPHFISSIRQPCSAITQYRNGAMRLRARERKSESGEREGDESKEGGGWLKRRA